MLPSWWNSIDDIIVSSKSYDELTKKKKRWYGYHLLLRILYTTIEQLNNNQTTATTGIVLQVAPLELLLFGYHKNSTTLTATILYIFTALLDSFVQKFPALLFPLPSSLISGQLVPNNSARLGFFSWQQCLDQQQPLRPLVFSGKVR